MPHLSKPEKLLMKHSFDHHSEYATCAWSPHTKTDIQKVEQVQRSAARFVAGDYRRTSSVTAMCTDLKWDSLQTRRVARDATMFFKVYHGFVGIQLPAIIIKADTRTRCHHEFKLRAVPASLSHLSAFILCTLHTGMELSTTTCCIRTFC